MGLDMRLGVSNENGKKTLVTWRKANQIHNWFVQNVQNGKDECRTYRVTSAQLITLRDTCKKVIDASQLIPGKVVNGYLLKDVIEAEFIEEDGDTKGFLKEPILEDGLVIKDPSVAEDLLPTIDGFFFGSRNYDEFYYDDVKRTYHELSKLLKDQNTSAEYFYSASW